MTQVRVAIHDDDTQDDEGDNEEAEDDHHDGGDNDDDNVGDHGVIQQTWFSTWNARQVTRDRGGRVRDM